MVQDDNLDIAIVGMAGRFPGAKNIDAYWENLVAGKESITFFSDDDLADAGISDALITDPSYVKAAPILDHVKAFDERFFGYSPREARMMDPQHRLFLEESWHALEHAGYNPEAIEGPVSIFGGSAMNTYLLFTGLLPRFVDEYLPTLIGSDKDFLTTRVSYKLNLKGPSVTVQTACSTSLVAVHMACQSLLNGESDLALAGGVSVRVPHIAGHVYAKGSVFTPDGHCRPFDARANGTIFGSGVGVVVLKRLEDAREDNDTIHAVIKGSAINNDGAAKADYTAPSVQSQSDAIAEALEVAGVDASSISYIEAHGTGTYLGDPIEIAALTRAFRSYTDQKGFCKIGSAKSNIGHLDAAAGMAGLIKTVLALKHEQLPATINFERPNPEANFPDTPFTVNHTLSDWESDDVPRRAGVSSLGIGGTNAHVILEEAPLQAFASSTKKRQLLVLSARTPDALEQLTQEMGDCFAGNPASSFASAAYTLQQGRKSLGHRRFCVAGDVNEAASIFKLGDEAQMYTMLDAPHRQSVVFMCTGQGAQYVQMGAGLYDDEPVFKEWIDRLAAFAASNLGIDIRELLFPGADGEASATERLNLTANTQPALFIVEYALSQLWMSWGIRPNALIGHSVGELTAACIAGVFSWQDALTLIVERGRLMQSMPAGDMLAVQASEKQLAQFLADGLELAGVNSPGFCVVSGAPDAITVLSGKLERAEIKSRLLHTSHAFHSSMMDPVLEAFASKFEGVKLNPPAISFISNLSGTWITDEEATDPAYWTRQLRQPVRFADGIAELLKEEGRIFLEVGPGNTLGTFVRKHDSFDDRHTVLSSLRHPNEKVADQKRLLETLGKLWVHGQEIDWEALHKNKNRKRVPLPTYPFARNEHWFVAKGNSVDAGLPSVVQHRGRGHKNRSPEIVRNDPGDWYYLPSWKRSTGLDQTINGLEAGAHMLVFCKETVLDTLFVEKAAKLGFTVTVVVVGDRYEEVGKNRFAINPANPSDYNSLFDTLASNNALPRYILHFWGYSHKKEDDNSLEEIKSTTFYSQVHLARALSKHVGREETIKIGLVTAGLFEVIGHEKVEPEKALMLGPAMVLPKELPFYRSFVVDIPLDDALPDNALLDDALLDDALKHETHCSALLADLVLPQPAAYIAYRGRHRWTRHFEQIQLSGGSELQNTHRGTIKEGGVYLLTGGLGGIGLALAESFAQRKGVKLVLVGRRAMPERGAWDHWLLANGEEDATSVKINAIRALRRQGAEVLTYAADVARWSDVEALVRAVKDEFGKIDGVVHAAGVAMDGITLLKDADSFEKVLAAKVHGTINLGKALASEQPDFFLLCSSINAHVAPAGQADYVSANLFMDHFAPLYASKTGIQTQSINWPGWTETGMLAALRRSENAQPGWLNQAIQRGVATKEGVTACLEIVESDACNIVVSPVTYPYPLEAREQMRGAVTTSRPASTKGSSPIETNGKVSPANAKANTNAITVEAQLQSIWGEVLEVAEVGMHDSFFDLGGNSLMAITLFAEIERQLGRLNVPLSALLEAPTIAAFAKHVNGQKVEKRDTSLVTIQEGHKGNSTPLFCIHGAGGNVLIYRQLAEELGPAQTVYGFQASGLDGSQPILSDIESMASLYIDEMLRVNPEGPYFLLGYCMGGTIAWEIGQQLMKRGISRVYLFILETYNWKSMDLDSRMGKLRYYTEKIYFHLRNYASLDTEGKERFMKEKKAVLKRRRKKWKGTLLNRLGRNKTKRQKEAGMDEELLARIWKTNDDAALVYNPQPYAGPVVHIRPKNEYGRHQGVNMGWGLLAPDLTTITLPVYPAGMLVSPYVPILAKELRKQLDMHQSNDKPTTQNEPTAKHFD